MKRYLKKEIKLISTEDLNSRFCRILERAEMIDDAEDIPVADAREILWIEDELHERIIAAVGHDFYPPEVVAKPTMADLRARLNPFKKSTPAPSSKLKPMSKKIIPRATEIIHPCSAAVTKIAEMKKEGALRFKITITSSIGSVVKTQNVKVDSRSEADTIAIDLIKELGLKKAKYKIS